MIIAAVARGHNASTTLLVDGKVIFYVEEERLTKMKHDGAPLMGLMKVFDYVDHIDHLVICHTHRHGPQLDWTGEDLYAGFVRKLARKKFDFRVHSIDMIHHKMHVLVVSTTLVSSLLLVSLLTVLVVSCLNLASLKMFCMSSRLSTRQVILPSLIKSISTLELRMLSVLFMRIVVRTPTCM